MKQVCAETRKNVYISLSYMQKKKKKGLVPFYVHTQIPLCTVSAGIMGLATSHNTRACGMYFWQAFFILSQTLALRIQVRVNSELSQMFAPLSGNTLALIL